MKYECGGLQLQITAIQKAWSGWIGNLNMSVL
jgi:hypothetical protein